MNTTRGITAEALDNLHKSRPSLLSSLGSYQNDAGRLDLPLLTAAQGDALQADNVTGPEVAVNFTVRVEDYSLLQVWWIDAGGLVDYYRIAEVAGNFTVRVEDYSLLQVWWIDAGGLVDYYRIAEVAGNFTVRVEDYSTLQVWWTVVDYFKMA